VGIVQRHRKVSRIGKRSQQNKLIPRIHFKVQLIIGGVEISVLYVPDAAAEVYGIAGTIEIREEVTRRKLLAGKRSWEA
jgi:hypothetical protein